MVLKGGVWCSGVVRTSYGVGLWKYIRSGWDLFASYTRIEVGDDSTYCFGRITRLAMEVLKIHILSYSDLLQMAMLLCQTLWSGSMVLCSASLFSIVKLEIEIQNHVFSDLYSVKITPLVSDHLVWLPSPNKGFQVRSFYYALLLRTRRSTTFPWKGIWKVGLPPRVAFFYMDCYTRQNLHSR